MKRLVTEMISEVEVLETETPATEELYSKLEVKVRKKFNEEIDRLEKSFRRINEALEIQQQNLYSMMKEQIDKEIRSLQEKIGWSPADVDLYEINEAFACVAMAAIHDLELDHAKVNVNGGACALGHPIGASGARVIVTLLHALKARGGKRGIAALCIGGGEAVSMAVEIA